MNSIQWIQFIQNHFSTTRENQRRMCQVHVKQVFLFNLFYVEDKGQRKRRAKYLVVNLIGTC